MSKLNKSEARVYNSMCKELRYSLETLQGIKNGVSIFGSARSKRSSEEYKVAYELGKLLGKAGYDVISGGGPGLMEAANKGALEVGAKSVGLNIILPHEQAPNDYQNLSVTFKYFAIRKVCFIKYAKAFVCCPGGFGTADEMFEALTLIQNGGINKCPVILLGKRYWMPMYYWLESVVKKFGKIGQRDLQLIKIVDKPKQVLDILRRI